jgi:Tol biopolymer transport system component
LHRSIALRTGPYLARIVLWGVVVVALVVLLGGYLHNWRATTGDAEGPPTTRPFTSFPGPELDPGLSPSGEKVVFAKKTTPQNDFDIYIGQLGAETPLQITNARSDERFPTWSPDGLHLAFVRSARGSHGIFIVPSIGGNERRVADLGARQIKGLAWAPDGQSFAVAAQPAPFSAFRLYQVPIDGTSLQPWTVPPTTIQGDFEPAFAPDGNRLAFSRKVDDEVHDIFVTSMDQREPRQLTFDSTRIAGLAWTRDGKELVFASARGGVWGLWRVSANGGEPTWIATASEGSLLEHPSLALRDNQLVYVERSSNTNIWRFWRRPPQNTPRLQPFIFSTRWDSNPDISPNWERVAFVSDQSG